LLFSFLGAILARLDPDLEPQHRTQLCRFMAEKAMLDAK